MCIARLSTATSKDSDTSTKSNSEISQINSFSCFFSFFPLFSFGLCLIHIHYAQHNCLRPLFLSAWLAFGLISFFIFFNWKCTDVVSFPAGPFQSKKSDDKQSKNCDAVALLVL